MYRWANRTSLPNATCTNITNVIYYILTSFKDLPEDGTVVPKHFWSDKRLFYSYVHLVGLVKENKRLYFPQAINFDCGAHPTSCTMVSDALFPRLKLPERDVDHSPPF